MTLFINKSTTTSTTTTTCLPVCLYWDCWINVTATFPYVSSTINPNTTTATTTLSPDEIERLALTNLIQDLQNENYRLKVGLEAGVLTTGSAAVGSFIYFTRR
ncbi:unnamed protein product [Adineta steineri]|uniref:Uncharacterized protein n=1 Tax=Adineta steineri TaxID=433720 RepID=A0A815CIH4_9BILA|nr:unnamed protein product [Adineta steineri]CAF1563772.1 unnamed protein product [Adineta steineri]